MFTGCRGVQRPLNPTRPSVLRSSTKTLLVKSKGSSRSTRFVKDGSIFCRVRPGRMSPFGHRVVTRPRRGVLSTQTRKPIGQWFGCQGMVHGRENTSTYVRGLGSSSLHWERVLTYTGAGTKRIYISFVS